MVRGLAARAAQCFVALVLVAAAALSVAYHWSHLQTWWLELTRYAPYPVYLVPAAMALAVSLNLGRVWRVAALLGLGLVVTFVMGLEVGRSDAGSGRFRLMTYNIKAHLAEQTPGGFAGIARELLQHNPDVIVMQDAGTADDMSGVPPARFQKLLGNRQAFVFKQYVVASRLPLKGCVPGSISFRGEGQTYVRCVLVAGGREIDLVTVHFVSPREGLNAARHEHLEGVGDWKRNFAERLMQARKLAGDLSGNPRPLIVAGDLNSLESSPVIRALRDIGLRDAFSSAGLGYGFTQGHALRIGFSFLRIDHILVGSTIGVLDCFVGGSQGSEHRPVIADLWAQRE